MAVDFLTYQIVLRGILFGQQTRNVFYYQADQEPDSDTIADLGTAFEAQFFAVDDIGLRQEIFSTEMAYTGYRITALQDPIPLRDVEFPDPFVGGTTGEALPPTNCLAFRSTQTRGDVRSGQKRFAGVIEAAVAQGIYLAAFDADVDNLAVRLATPLAVTVGTCSPVIVKRILVPGTPPAPDTYRLPETLAETDVASASTWVPNRIITTQNTRKIGRGA